MTENYHEAYLTVQSGLRTGIAPPSNSPSVWNYLDNAGYSPVLRINHKVTEPVSSYEITMGATYIPWGEVSYVTPVSIRNTTSSYNPLVLGNAEDNTTYIRFGNIGVAGTADRYAYHAEIGGHGTDTFSTTIEGGGPVLSPVTRVLHVEQIYNRVLYPYYGDFITVELPINNAVPAVWCATGTQTQLAQSRPEPPTVVVGPCP